MLGMERGRCGRDEVKRKKGDEVEVSEINLLFTSPTLFLNSKPIPNHQPPLTTTTGPPAGTSDAALHASAAGGRNGAEEGVEVGGRSKPLFPTTHTILKPHQPPNNQITARGLYSNQ